MKDGISRRGLSNNYYKYAQGSKEHHMNEDRENLRTNQMEKNHQKKYKLKYLKVLTL